MGSFLFEIRKAVDEQLKSYGLTDYQSGTVVSIAPLKIKISDRITLEGEQIIQTNLINNLNRNDRVCLLKVRRGQAFIILGKEV